MPRPAPIDLIDEVDQNDLTIGQVARRDALSEARGFRTVHVLVTDGSGNLLLQRLAPRRQRHPSRLGSSVAAYLHSGETYEAAAVRRSGEELGVEAPLTELGKFSMQDGTATKWVKVFRCVAPSPKIQEPDHIASIERVPIDDLQDDVRANPGSYTPTFVELLEALGDSISGLR